MTLIGFTGSMGSGKSTAIECLKEIQVKQVSNIKFAQPLYDIQEAIYSIIKTVHQRPSTFIKDRKLLQWLGTEWGRDTISKTLWIDLWKRDVEYLQQNYPSRIIVSDDVRFENEVDTVKSLGGYIIKIESNKDRIVKEGTGHSSELGISSEKIDYIIENNGTLDDLKTSLLTLNSKLELW